MSSGELTARRMSVALRGLSVEGHRMEVTNRYLELLADEGYRPKVVDDEATEIEFKAERLRYRLVLDPKDPEFVAVTLSYRIDEGHPLEQLFALANDFNQRIKVVKTLVHPAGELVRFAFEALSRDPLPPELLERALGFLRSTSDEYFEEIRREQPAVKA